MIKYTIIVNNKAHQIDIKVLKKILQLGKEKCEKSKLNAIYAVRKNNLVELRNDVFADKNIMDKEIKKYRDNKIKVYFTQKMEE